MAPGGDDFTVRADALRSLRGGGPAAQKLLIARLRDDGDAYVRRVIAETLVAFPSTASANALVDFLAASEKAEDRDSRRAAQRALCVMAGVRAARPVDEWRAWAAGVDERAAKKPDAAGR
jgi:HEAT repeat protein